MTLREKLVVLRDKAGISQMSLAHQLDVSRQAVSRWESGTATPSMDKLKTLAKIYDVSLDWLCSDAADIAPHEAVAKDCVEGTNGTIIPRTNEKKIRIIQRIAIALTIGVVIFICAWLMTKKENNEIVDTQIEDLSRGNIDVPDENKFDFEWKE